MMATQIKYNVGFYENGNSAEIKYSGDFDTLLEAEQAERQIKLKHPTGSAWVNFASLSEVIDMRDFSFDEYWSQENLLVKPRLEELGFNNVHFLDGERDSFGPLTRIVRCWKEGKKHQFIYG